MDLPNLMFCIMVALPMATSDAIDKRCDLVTGRCYWVGSGGVLDWAGARSTCQSQGGDLAVMETKQLWDFIYTEFSISTSSTNFWLGLTDNEHEGVYRWINRDVLTYNEWGPSDPKGETGEQCDVIYGGILADAPCTWNSLAVLCSDIAPMCTSIRDGCRIPEAVVLIQTTLDELHDAATYNDAIATCQAQGKRLLTARDMDKEQQIRKHHQTSDMVWLGLSDDVMETVFRWHDDGHVTTWVNWGPEDPNQSFNANCVARQGSDGKWVDATCNRQFHFYCEKG